MNGKLISFSLAFVTLAASAIAQDNDWDQHQKAAANARIQGNLKQAEIYLKTTIKIAERFPAGDTRLPSTLNDLARVYIAEKKYSLAEPLYRRSLLFYEKYVGPDTVDTASSMNRLAEVYRLQGKYAEAEPLYMKALSIHEKTPVGNNAALGTVLNNLGLTYLEQKKYAEAELLLKRALDKRQAALGSESILVAETLQNYAELLMETDRKKEAKKMLSRAREILSQP